MKNPRQEGERQGLLSLGSTEIQYPEFSEQAQQHILDTLQYGDYSGEELTDFCKEVGIFPKDDRAFGPVCGRLSRKGKIVCVGYGTRSKGHGTAGLRIWSLAKDKESK